MVNKCTAETASGKPCKGKALEGSEFCWSHDPELAARRAEGQRRGGEAKATARRAAKLLVAIGEQIDAADLPAILRGCIVGVQKGTLEPSQATAIATLAKTSVSLSQAIELEERIEALEQMAGLQEPTPIRKVV